MKFIGDVAIEKVGIESFELLENLSYSNDKLKVTCETKFVTDGYSAPKWVRGLMGSPFTGNSLEASIIHDGLYKSHITTREFADDLFDEMLKVSGVSKWKRILSVWAVQKFAKDIWDNMGYTSMVYNKELVKIKYKEYDSIEASERGVYDVGGKR